MSDKIIFCAVCGKPLPQRRFKYCSDGCQQEASKQRRNALSPGRQGPKLKTIICPDCGKEAQVFTKSYRCPDCQAEADARANVEYKRRKVAGKIRQIGSTDLCRRCGQPYTVEAGLQKYCKGCAEIALKEYHREKGIEYYHEKYDGKQEKEKRNQKRRLPRYEPIHCRICGEIFIPGTRHTVYCSKKCAKEGHKLACRQWMADNKEKRTEYMRRYKAKQKTEDSHAN